MNARTVVRGEGTLAVYYGTDTVGVYPKDDARNSASNVVIGPLPRTPENIERCNAIVAAANAKPYAALFALIDRAAYMLSDAQSGFISGTGSDEAWRKSRDELVVELKATLLGARS